jgi:hypothetical protein
MMRRQRLEFVASENKFCGSVIVELRKLITYIGVEKVMDMTRGHLSPKEKIQIGDDISIVAPIIFRNINKIDYLSIVSIAGKDSMLLRPLFSILKSDFFSVDKKKEIEYIGRRFPILARDLPTIDNYFKRKQAHRDLIDEIKLEISLKKESHRLSKLKEHQEALTEKKEELGQEIMALCESQSRELGRPGAQPESDLDRAAEKYEALKQLLSEFKANQELSEEKVKELSGLLKNKRIQRQRAMEALPRTSVEQARKTLPVQAAPATPSQAAVDSQLRVSPVNTPPASSSAAGRSPGSSAGMAGSATPPPAALQSETGARLSPVNISVASPSSPQSQIVETLRQGEASLADTILQAPATPPSASSPAAVALSSEAGRRAVSHAASTTPPPATPPRRVGAPIASVDSQLRVSPVNTPPAPLSAAGRSPESSARRGELATPPPATPPRRAGTPTAPGSVSAVSSGKSLFKNGLSGSAESVAGRSQAASTTPPGLALRVSLQSETGVRLSPVALSPAARRSSARMVAPATPPPARGTLDQVQQLNIEQVEQMCNILGLPMEDIVTKVDVEGQGEHQEIQNVENFVQALTLLTDAAVGVEKTIILKVKFLQGKHGDLKSDADHDAANHYVAVKIKKTEQSYDVFYIDPTGREISTQLQTQLRNLLGNDLTLRSSNAQIQALGQIHTDEAGTEIGANGNDYDCGILLPLILASHTLQQPAAALRLNVEQSNLLGRILRGHYNQGIIGSASEIISAIEKGNIASIGAIIETLGQERAEAGAGASGSAAAVASSSAAAAAGGGAAAASFSASAGGAVASSSSESDHDDSQQKPGGAAVASPLSPASAHRRPARRAAMPPLSAASPSSGAAAASLSSAQRSPARQVGTSLMATAIEAEAALAAARTEAEAARAAARTEAEEVAAAAEAALAAARTEAEAARAEAEAAVRAVEQRAAGEHRVRGQLLLTQQEQALIRINNLLKETIAKPQIVGDQACQGRLRNVMEYIDSCDLETEQESFEDVIAEIIRDVSAIKRESGPKTKGAINDVLRALTQNKELTQNFSRGR